MELIFIPLPAIGHLVSLIEFAKRLLDEEDRFSVTVLIVDPLFTPKVQSYVESLAAASVPRLRFFFFPIEADTLSITKGQELCYFFQFLETHKSNIKNYIINQVFPTCSGSVAGFVVDLFTTPMIDVANELGLPTYVFYIFSVACLRFTLHVVLTRHDQVGRAFRASDSDLVIPGCANPVPLVVAPSVLFDETGGYTFFVKFARRLKEAKAIIVNSFEELESQAVKSLLELDLPPFYLVGPVLDLRGHSSELCDKVQGDEIMKWLDNQPQSSVIFLCFGSMVDMDDEPQVVEIAKGLEQCGYRFLWSLRIQSNCTNLEQILPEGFLKRTQGRGLVCGWVPQIEVLAHKSIGGFVSHCGWNSILESIWYGVPILTWPMHSEQQLNAFEMVKALGLAVEMRLDYKLGESDMVMADEICKAIKCLMDGDSEVKKRVKKMGQASREAVSKNNNGTSYTSYGQLIELFMTGNANGKH
ncbi:hypothetical protein PTKIN_Ptkin15bG0169000 [Pterospermum kingtungense]